MTGHAVSARRAESFGQGERRFVLFWYARISASPWVLRAHHDCAKRETAALGLNEWERAIFGQNDGDGCKDVRCSTAMSTSVLTRDLRRSHTASVQASPSEAPRTIARQPSSNHDGTKNAVVAAAHGLRVTTCNQVIVLRPHRSRLIRDAPPPHRQRRSRRGWCTRPEPGTAR